jgi:L-threonylcarbamoyladenylate synthase
MDHLLINPDENGVQKAANLIRNGGLVAFPTETVYGLGANALNEDAVKSIFVAKGRPLTDPLIVHIAETNQVYELVELNSAELFLFDTLISSFWPGPLTLIVKASPKIPLLVTADTGFVGVRRPNHPLAVKLLAAAGLPIAAPSANRFGHVSPTTALTFLPI